MNKISPLSFEDLSDIFSPLGAISSPAELHGMLCGQICGGSRLPTEKYVHAAWEFLDLPGEPHGEAREAIIQLYSGSSQQLNDEEFGLVLVLPEDETDLDQLSVALGQWCHGFLNGFGSAGIDGEQTLSRDASEALRDFAAIVQIGVDEDADEEAEASYMEVVEYVRMATLALFAEFGQLEQGESSATSGSSSSPNIMH